MYLYIIYIGFYGMLLIVLIYCIYIVIYKRFNIILKEKYIINFIFCIIIYYKKKNCTYIF